MLTITSVVFCANHLPTTNSYVPKVSTNDSMKNRNNPKTPKTIEPIPNRTSQ